MSEDIICISCNKEEKDPKKVIECMQCHKSEHFKCRNIFGAAIRKLRDQDYFCSLECQEFHQRSSRGSSADSQVLNELRTVLREVQGTRAEVQDMKSTIAEVERFQNFLSNQLDTFLAEVKSLKVEQAVLKSGANEMKEKHQELSRTVNELEMEVDHCNRIALSKNAILLGMPTKKDENVKQIVENLSTAIGYELPVGAIVEVKRLSASDPKQRNKDLYRQVREVQESLNFKYVWPGRNGVILAKKTETSKPEIIRSRSDVQGLQRTGSKRNFNNSTSSMQSSPIQEPVC